RLEKELAEQKGMRDEQLAIQSCRCNGIVNPKYESTRKCPKAGDGFQCKAAEKPVQTYVNSVIGIEAQLAKLKPAMTIDAGLAHGGEVIGAMARSSGA